MKEKTTKSSGGYLSGKLPFIWIALLGFLVYFWTIFFGFSYFDDKTLILDNLFYLKNLGNIFNAFTIEVFHVLHASAAYYRPMLTISFMLDAQISGSSPWFYHITNIVIHLINSCLLFVLLQKLNIKKDLAFVFSLIFTVHPVLAQAVAWIPGRNDSLLFLFVAAAMIRIIEVKNWRDVFWHLLFFALAIFTKESGVLVPVLVILWFGAYHLGGVKKPARQSYTQAFAGGLTPRYFSLIFGWLAILVVWFLLRRGALVNPIQYHLSEVLKAEIATSPAILLFLGKIFLPFNLSVLPTLQDSTLIFGLISLIGLVRLVLFSKSKKLLVISFGTIWFLMFLLPSFVRPDNNYVPDFLEHRVYLPIVGIFLILSEIDFIKNLDFSKKKIIWFFIIIISVITIINFVHTFNFRNRLAFWQSAVKTSPSHPLAHKNLGAMLFWDNDFADAEKEFQESLRLNPQETMAHNNLGLIYFNQGDYKRAEEEYQKELTINPAYDNAFFNYGLLAYKLGKVDDAEKFWLKTLEVNPDYTDAMKNLLIIYSQKKDQVKVNYYYKELQKRGITLNMGL